MELTPRLKKIAELIPAGTRTIADIGTDHAYLPVYCILNGRAENALAMDVNEGPLARAAESAAKYNLVDKIDLRLSDGIEKLDENEADVVVIAGMGGLLIRKILEEGRAVLSPDTLLILQPMIAQTQLREYLFTNGFNVKDEYVVCEGSKLYNIMVVSCGEKGGFDEKDIVIGRNLRKNSPELFKRYAEYKIRILKKIISGMEKSVSSNDSQAVRRELEIFENELERSMNNED